jgi:hypothetical protein
MTVNPRWLRLVTTSLLFLKAGLRAAAGRPPARQRHDCDGVPSPFDLVEQVKLTYRPAGNVSLCYEYIADYLLQPL